MRWRKPLSFPILVFFSLLFSLFISDRALAGDLKHPLFTESIISTGKYIKQNAAVPVTVDISNPGKDFSGRLEVLFRNSHKRDDFSSFYRDIQISKGGRKRYFLYIPRSIYYTDNVIVRIKDRNDFKDNKIKFSRAQKNDVIVMILNREQGGFAYLTGYKSLIPKNASIYVSYPDPDKLPRAWKGLESMDYVLINDLPALNLERDAEKALLDYVVAGGTLIFTSNLDPNEFNGSIFKGHLPIIPAKTVTLTDEDNKFFNKEEVLIMEGNVTGETLLRKSNAPLLTKKNLGEGQIFFITADLSRKPFSQEYEEKELWNSIFAARSQVRKENLRADNANILNQLPELAAPPLATIFWSLLIYIILIGPVNYFYIKKKDKLLNIFINVPVIALIFSVGIFMLGYSTKGSKILLRKFNLVYIRAGQSYGFIDSAVSLFSPGKTTYDIAILDPLITGWESGNPYRMPKSVVKEEGTLTFEDLKIQMWSRRSFRMQKPHYFKEPSAIHVRVESGAFKGTITNGAGKKLTGCVLYHKGSISAPFDLEPGTKQINLALAKKGLFSKHLVSDHLNNIYGINEDGNKDKPNPMNVAKRNAVTAISEVILKSGNRIVLIGWNEDDLLKMRLNKKNPSLFNVNLFFIR